MKRAKFLPLLPLALLTACGSNGGFPSLARRPAERISGSAPVAEATSAPAPAPAAPDPDLQSHLARLGKQAGDAHARFTALAPRTRSTVATAQGSAVASDPWSVATVALAELESRRSEAMVALADLDSLYVKARIDGGDSNAIAAVRDQVTAWVADEDAVLADLRGRIAG